MELRSLLRLLRRRMLPVLVAVLAGGAAGFAVSPRQSQYQSTATIYVGERDAGGSGSRSGDQGVGLVLRAQTFAELVESEELAADAIELAGIDTTAQAVLEATTAAVEPGTTLIRITVVDADPSVSQALTNGLADALIEEVQTLEPGGAGDQDRRPNPPARIFERARLPVEPLYKGTLRNVLLGAALGLVMSVALVLLADQLDVSDRSRYADGSPAGGGDGGEPRPA